MSRNAASGGYQPGTDEVPERRLGQVAAVHGDGEPRPAPDAAWTPDDGVFEPASALDRPAATTLALTPEDEKRPVVRFLRLAGWPDWKIAEVVAAHKRGETQTYSVTFGGDNGKS